MNLILACDIDGGIGYQGGLPWDKIEGDLPRFKRLTQGQTVIMGRNTWDSLPKKPLPKRINVVVSSRPLDKDYDNVVRTTDIQFSTDESSWLIGGANLIDQCWDKIDTIYLTKVLDRFTCDTYIDLSIIESNYTRLCNQDFGDHLYQIWKKK